MTEGLPSSAERLSFATRRIRAALAKSEPVPTDYAHDIINISPGHFLDLAASDTGQALRTPYLILNAFNRINEMSQEADTMYRRYAFAQLGRNVYDELLKPFTGDFSARKTLADLVTFGLENKPTPGFIRFAHDYAERLGLNDALSAPSILGFIHAETQFDITPDAPHEKRYTRYLMQARNIYDLMDAVGHAHPTHLTRLSDKAVKMAVSYAVISDIETVLKGEALTHRPVFDLLKQDELLTSSLARGFRDGYAIIRGNFETLMADDTENGIRHDAALFDARMKSAHAAVLKFYRTHYRRDMQVEDADKADTNTLYRVTQPPSHNSEGSKPIGPKTGHTS